MNRWGWWLNGQVSKCICLGCKIYLSENQKYLQTRSWKPILKEHFMAKMTPTIRKEARTTPMSSLPGRRRKLESFFLWIQMMMMMMMIHNMVIRNCLKAKKKLVYMSLHRRRGWSAGRFVSQSETGQLYFYVFPCISLFVCIPIWNRAVVFLCISMYFFIWTNNW